VPEQQGDHEPQQEQRQRGEEQRRERLRASHGDTLPDPLREGAQDLRTFPE
jgi:hypothetical protein